MKLIINKFNSEDMKVWDNFVINDSLNGTIYHTMLFLSYHKDKFEDSSIMLYDKNKLIAVFPCCKINEEYYSHRGSTCGGIVILENYYELIKLTEIMDMIYDYYNGNLHIKLSETVYFKNNIKNDLLNFVLSQKCKSYQDISLFFDVNRNDNIIDSFPKNDNKRLLLKYIKNTDKEMSFVVSNEVEDYINYYFLLEKILKERNDVKPLHSLDEFILLKELLRDKQFLFLSKDSNGNILSGSLVFLINSNTYYTVYLMTNYEKENSQVFYLLYELFELAKRNNISTVNLGACSTGGGKDILYSKYKFKSSCGCEPSLKYSYSYTKKRSFFTDNLNIKNMEINEQYLISYFWQNNKYASGKFFLKNNTFNYDNQINWYNNIEEDSSSSYLSIFENVNNNFIGYCGIKNITINDCELFIVLLDNNYYKKGFGKESFQCLINYTQTEFPNKEIYLNVKNDNKIAIQMYKKLKFSIESEKENLVRMIL